VELDLGVVAVGIDKPELTCRVLAHDT
jgi:hypothetical protein